MEDLYNAGMKAAKAPDFKTSFSAKQFETSSGETRISAKEEQCISAISSMKIVVDANTLMANDMKAIEKSM